MFGLEAIIIMAVGTGLSVGSIGVVAKGCGTFGIKAWSYHSSYRKAKKKIKNGILNGEFGLLNAGIRSLKNFDAKYNTDKVEKIYFLYNINDEIAEKESAFMERYNLRLYDKLTKEQIEEVVNEHIKENELTLIDTSKSINEYFLKKTDSNITNLTDTDENEEII